MKNFTKQLSTLLTLALLATSCQEGDMVGDLMPDFEPITFKTSVTTRATDTAFEAGDEISVTAYLTDGSIFGANANYTYNGSVFSSNSPIQVVGEPVEMSYRAVYPYVEMPESKVISFDVQTDQSADSNYTLSDLMSSYASATDSTTPTLVFDHLMSKIVVNITSENVEMTNVTVTANAATGVEYNLATLSSTAQGSVASITMAKNATNSYKAILVPQTIAAGSTFVSISIAGVPYDIGFSQNVTILGGCQYTISATIVDNTITFDSPLINDWTEGTLTGDGDGNIDDDGVTATMTLADISADNLPTANTWIFTDESAQTSSSDSGDFTALHSALAAAVEDDRTIKVEFSNLTEIPQNAFRYCTSLTSISAPKVETVGDCVFYRCTSLTDINLPVATTFGGYTFSGCSSLTAINLPEATTFGDYIFSDCSLLAEVNLPEATTFGDYSFYASSSSPNEALTSIYLPKATSFGSRAFYFYKALESVDMPEMLTFGDMAFLGTASIASVSLPKVTTFEGSAFVGLVNAQYESLTSIYLPKVKSFGGAAFNYCSVLNSVDMPEVNTFGDYAFYCSYGLTSIDMSEVTTFGDYAFSNCSDLTSVNLPEVTTFGDSAFTTCSGLTSVNLPEVTTFGDSAFTTCSDITSLNLPNLITLGDSAFSGCANLTDITLNSQYFTTEGGVIYNSDITSIIYIYPSVTEYSAPATILSIGDDIFYAKSSLTTVSLPEVITLGDRAFNTCSALTSVSIPKATTFGSYSFCTCSNLTSVELPETTTLGTSTFVNCSKLASVELPKLATFSDGFYVTNALTALKLATEVKLESIGSIYATTTNITLTTGSVNSQYVSGNTLTVGEFSADFAEIVIVDSFTDDGTTATMTLAEISADNLPTANTWVFTDVTVSSNSSTSGDNSDGTTTTTGSSSDSGMESDYGSLTNLCSALDAALAQGRYISVEFPNLTAIPDYAFTGCSSLYSISAPKVLSIGACAFQGCELLDRASFSTATTLSYSVFYSSISLRSLSLPKLVTYESYSFTYLLSLTTLEINSDYFLFDGGVLYDKNQTKIIAGMNALLPADYVAPSTVVSIDSNAFQYATSLNSVSLPSVTTLGNRIFFYCSNLTSVNVPNITTIGYGAFGGGCTALSTMTLATNSEFVSIDEYAFESATTTNITLTTSSDNSYYVSDNTLTVGSFSAEFAGIDFVAAATETMALADISANNLPTANTWIITDSTAQSNGNDDYGDFAALRSALTAAAEAGRSISLEFTNLTQIPSYLFSSCSSLKAISAPEVESVGEFAFSDCWNLKSASLPSMTSVGISAFYGCSLLSSLTADELITISESAFGYCAFTSLSFPKVTYVSQSAFWACNSLVSISLPVVQEIGGGVFAACENLESVTVNSSYFVFEDYVLYGYNKSTIIAASGKLSGDYTAPSSVEVVGDSAFYHCHDVSSVTLPNVTNIEASGFNYCSAMSSLSAPAVTSIDSYAFSSCASLKSMTLSTMSTSALAYIGEYAFNAIATSEITLTVGSTNSGCVSGNILTVGDFSAEFAQITVQ